MPEGFKGFQKGQSKPKNAYKFLKGIPQTRQHRKNRSKSMKKIYGLNPNCACGFKKGYIPWNKGSKVPFALLRFGERNHSWKGGKFTRKGNRVLIYKPEHPSVYNQRYVYEHRLVMEQHLRRYLKHEEVVHHLNGNPTDNRIENLIVLTSSEHSKIHHIMRKR
mgnify:CR=1 FL=1